MISLQGGGGSGRWDLTACIGEKKIRVKKKRKNGEMGLARVGPSRFLGVGVKKKYRENRKQDYFRYVQRPPEGVRITVDV